MGRLKSFDPIESKVASVLILGSMPGQESLRKRQYYANKRNSFWHIMGHLVGAGPEMKYVDRIRTLTDHRMALWDVLKTCDREGSLNSSILDKTVESNDFVRFFACHPYLTHVFFNGTKAETSYKRSVMPELPQRYAKLKYTRLPSTSPAYAVMSVNEKREHWRIITKSIRANE